MKRAGKPATYGLETFRDVLEKLEWEQNELKAAFEQEPKDPTKLYYRAFNAAVTAWHLADWVWKDMTPDQRQQLETDWKTKLGIDDDGVGNFRRALRLKSREIAICREIATASKHVESTQGRDESIDTVASATTSSVRNSDGEQIQANDQFVVVTRWKLKVKDGDKRRDFIQIIDLVIEFWTEFVKKRGIGK